MTFYDNGLREGFNMTLLTSKSADSIIMCVCCDIYIKKDL